MSDENGIANYILEIGAVMTVMTGFTTFVAGLVAERKGNKIKDDLEDDMKKQHEAQTNKIDEGHTRVIDKLDDIGGEITQIGITTATTQQKVDDMDTHLKAVDTKLGRVEETANENKVKIAGILGPNGNGQ